MHQSRFFTQPVQIALGVALGMNPHPARGHGVHGLLGEAGTAIPRPVTHLDEPLIGPYGLNRGLGTIGVPLAQDMRVRAGFQQPLLLQVFHHALAPRCNDRPQRTDRLPR